jgi:hypothetical protein
MEMKAASRIGLIVLLAAVASLATPRASTGAVCGEKPPSAEPNEKAPVAALTLNADTSRPTLKIGRDTDDQTLIFDYTITGCELPDNAEPPPDPQLDPHGDKQFDIPKVVTLGTPTIHGDVLTVRGVVHPKAFKPGKYNLVFRTFGTKLFAKQNTPVYISRSENLWRYPISAAIVGALVGLGLGVITVLAKATGDVKFSWVWGLVAVGAAVVAGFYVLRTDYFSDDVEVWSGASDWFKTAADAFLAGSTGALVAITAKVVHVKAKKRRKRRKAAESAVVAANSGQAGRSARQGPTAPEPPA